jgi:copper homeostasis protein
MKRLLFLVKVILTDMKFELEVIAFDVISCQLAAENGADRIELCANPHEGGTTPSHGMMKAARKSTHIQVFPIIRPRGGDFLYTQEEFETMKEDIKCAQDNGCEGVVIGILKNDGTVDLEKCQELVALAGKMEVTFHRAFDRVKDPLISLEQIIAIGCKRILSSGLKPTAIEGIALLKTLVSQANGRIKIMPGSGVRAENIIRLAKDTGATCFHSSARKTLESQMQYLNSDMKESLVQVSLDGTEVKHLKNNLVTHFHSTL